MRKNHAIQILPTLAANQKSKTILIIMNNAARTPQLVENLGRERVLIGCPLPGGDRDGHIIHIVPSRENQPWKMPIGEVDGRVTDRARQIAAVLSKMRGHQIEIRTDMDAWLKCHVGLIASALSAVIYVADIDPQRLARTPDALILSARCL